MLNGNKGENKMYQFKRITNGFNYIFEKELIPNEKIVLKMPSISSNKRGINDIGWQTNGDVTLWGTISSKPESDNAIWQEIRDNDDVNKTISAIKIVNGSTKCRIAIRVILN